MSDTLPNVLICGGLNSASRALTALLVPINGKRLVNNVRIVDKYSVKPPTTYLGSEFPAILEQPKVEYKQANLTIASVVTGAFEPPSGQPPFDYVFDLTGETGFGRAEQIHISNTFQVARLLGQEAAKRKVKAYVRYAPAVYETPDKGTHDEKENIKPVGDMGIWMHESLRALGAIKDLNLVIVRSGLIYGPYVNSGIYAKVFAVAAVYGYLKEPMSFFNLAPTNSLNTVHVDDLAAGFWECANWISKIGRAEADKVAGEEITFHNEKSNVKKVEGVSPHNEKIIAPLFNLADDSNLTLESAATDITKVFGTKPHFGMDMGGKFVDAAASMIAKVFKLEDQAYEEINEHHVGVWTEMLLKSNPPIPNTPLSCYLDKWELQNQKVALNSNKIKKTIGYKLKYPIFNGNGEIEDIIDKWKAEKSWPNL